MLTYGRLARMIATVTAASAASAALRAQSAEPSRSAASRAPKVWDAQALEGWATPVAGLGVAPGYFSEEVYYAAPVDDLLTHPVYHPDYEPPGYREALIAAGPRPLIEPEGIESEAEWIEAGRRVFEALDTPLARSSDPRVLAHFTDAEAIDRYRDEHHDVMTRDGILLDYRWVVDREGKLNLGLSSCAGCHTRILPDGQLLPGAPSNFDLSDAPPIAIMLAQLRVAAGATAGGELYAQFGVPWLEDDPHLALRDGSAEELESFRALESGAPPGTTFDRFNGSPFHTTRMADLRGVRHRRYLDTTATHANRGPADIARYAVLVEFADAAVFGPHRMLPAEASRVPVRISDEALWAMALYIWSLEVPPSPHPFDDLAAHGRGVFEAEGCAKCHTPPHYTNNKLVAVPGFEPPDDAASAELDVSPRRVHTDPGLALRTRKGTGYYKIPSLRGLWYRGLYGHSGDVASLEDWFDPRRLRSDYVPTGWRGPGVERRAVPGHDFGLDLDAQDRRALIAFLRTL